MNFEVSGRNYRRKEVSDCFRGLHKQNVVDIICLLNLAALFSKLYLTVQKAGSEKRKGDTTRER